MLLKKEKLLLVSVLFIGACSSIDQGDLDRGPFIDAIKDITTFYYKKITIDENGNIVDDTGRMLYEKIESENDRQAIYGLSYKYDGFSVGYVGIALENGQLKLYKQNGRVYWFEQEEVSFDSIHKFRYWETLGSESISTGKACYPTMAIDNNNIPYVAYQDGSYGDKLTVKKFNGKEWEIVGQKGFSTGKALYVSLAISKNNIPYVAYKDVGKNSKGMVKRFDGREWETVGQGAFSTDRVDFVSLAIDKEGRPYVAYMDSGNEDKVTVRRLSGTIWETVGQEGFSENQAAWISLAINNSGTPYIAYQEVHIQLELLMKSIVKKFNGSTWEIVGQPLEEKNFPPKECNISITIDPQGNPYVAYYGKVKKFNGSTWETLGSNGWLYRFHVSLVISQEGILYIAYQEFHEISVHKYNGTYWEIVSEKDDSVGNSTVGGDGLYYDPSLAISKEGKLYIVYQNVKNGRKAYVKKLVE